MGFDSKDQRLEDALELCADLLGYVPKYDGDKYHYFEIYDALKSGKTFEQWEQERDKDET